MSEWDMFLHGISGYLLLMFWAVVLCSLPVIIPWLLRAYRDGWRSWLRTDESATEKPAALPKPPQKPEPEPPQVTPEEWERWGS